MIKLFKRNKTFSICFIITLILFMAGFFFNALIDDGTKKEISNNILIMMENINKRDTNLNLVLTNIFSTFTFTFVLWIFGMAVIGIPIVLFLYALKVFMFAFELACLISNLHINNLLFIIVYLSPKFLNLIICFILLYYSVNYSVVLTKLLFLKSSYNISRITKRYLKVLLFCLLCNLVSALFESLIILKVLKILV